MSKTRSFVFTINNYTPIDELEVETASAFADYLIYGREVGEQGTPHLQGFIRFKHPVTNRRVSDLLSRARIDRAKGTPYENFVYCSKDGDFVEFGERPTNTKRNNKQMWKDIIAWAEEGNVERIKEEYPHAYFLHHKKILDLRRRGNGILEGELENEWWVGPTGTGKSRRLWQQYPTHYSKSLNKWWDGYDDEEIVAIEEFHPDAGKYLSSFVKIWADRYPFSPEIKGGQLKKIRPKKIIILSNYTPDECFENQQDLLPIKRRFKVVHFNSL